MTADPLFIIGTERSGSNLLRLILNTHPDIAVPHPPHVVRYFAPIEAAYGDLSAEENLRRLVGDVLRLLDSHIYRWSIPIDGERLVREARPPSVLGVYVALMEQYREAQGKPRWGCKSTFMIAHVPELMRRFAEPRFLFLVRDPRDVAVSSRRSVYSTFHPYHTALLWRDQQRLGLRWLAELPPRMIRLVRYERLVAEPEVEVREICAFLGEPWAPEMLRFFETAEAKKSASLSESWAKTAEPVRTDSVGTWKTGLRPSELRRVEAVAGAEMDQLGYARVHPNDAPADAVAGPLFRLRCRGEALAYALGLELRSLVKDRNARQRWRRARLLRRLERQARGAADGR